LGCAVATGIICWFPAKPQVRGVLIVLGTVFLLATLALFADKLNHFQRDKNVTAADMAESVTLRPMLARVAWKMFLDKPVLGHGFGQYSAAKKPYHYTDTANMPLRRVLPYMQHNVFLSYLTESGLVGMTLLVLLLGSTALKSIRLWQSTRLEWVHRFFGLLVLSFVANYCINGMFHDVSIIPHTATLWFLLLGVLENLTARQGRGLALITDQGDSPLTGQRQAA
jgi:O-antigen ligase